MNEDLIELLKSLIEKGYETEFIDLDGMINLIRNDEDVSKYLILLCSYQSGLRQFCRKNKLLSAYAKFGGSRNIYSYTLKVSSGGGEAIKDKVKSDDYRFWCMASSLTSNRIEFLCDNIKYDR